MVPSLPALPDPILISGFAAEASLAVCAVVEAGAVCRRLAPSVDRPVSMAKADLSPVTVADFASQALVARLLELGFPDDPLIAEEDSGALALPGQSVTLQAVVHSVGRILPDATPEAVCRWIDRGRGGPADRFWVLDPIDGTKGFLRGDQYAVALALIEAGRVAVAVLGCPNLPPISRASGSESGSLLLAVRGCGTWGCPLAGGSFRRLHVSRRARPVSARLLRSFEAAHTDVSRLDSLSRALGTAEPPVRMDSQAKYALLATGEGELIVRIPSPFRPGYEERIWDHAAGCLMVEEAGGRVSDLHGRALDFGAGRTLRNNLGVLASNGRLHSDALRALAADQAAGQPQA